MEATAKLIRGVIIFLCAMLFLAGAVWNVYNPPQETTAMAEPSFAQTNAMDGLHTDEECIAEATIATEKIQKEQEQKEQEQKEQDIENRIAALRMQRDATWQTLYHAVEQLEFAEQQQTLNQYAQLQYKEQRLELLLQAKGLEPCLAVLEKDHANIIIPEAFLQTAYEKVYDLVLRNTDYTEEQIILVPFK